MPTATSARGWELDNLAEARWERHESDEPNLDEELALEAEVERAKQVVDGPRDDDEAGSTYSGKTLERATTFLTAYATRVYKICQLRIPVPHISPGPNASVDIHWNEVDWELLVNVPADPSREFSYYGDKRGGEDPIKGTLRQDTFDYRIITWMMSR
jgi:hypothetical protein